MGFDLFVQGLRDGDAAPLPRDVFDAVIRTGADIEAAIRAAG